MSNLKLQPGKFYKSRVNDTWCCFKVCPDFEKHCQAYCIRLADHAVEYFYIDGRYEETGKREHCLVKEVEP